MQTFINLANWFGSWIWWFLGFIVILWIASAIILFFYNKNNSDV